MSSGRATLGDDQDAGFQGASTLRVITAAELDEMPPLSGKRAFRASIIHDLDDVPPQYQHVIDEQRRRVLERETRQCEAS